MIQRLLRPYPPVNRPSSLLCSPVRIHGGHVADCDFDSGSDCSFCSGCDNLPCRDLCTPVYRAEVAIVKAFDGSHPGLEIDNGVWHRGLWSSRVFCLQLVLVEESAGNLWREKWQISKGSFEYANLSFNPHLTVHTMRGASSCG